MKKKEDDRLNIEHGWSRSSELSDDLRLKKGSRSFSSKQKGAASKNVTAYKAVGGTFRRTIRKESI